MNTARLLVIFVFLSSVCYAELRTWTAVNGKSLMAEFVSLNDGKVTLKPTTGKEFKVDLSKLSEADQDFATNAKRQIELEKTDWSVDPIILKKLNGKYRHPDTGEPYNGKAVYDGFREGKVRGVYKDGKREGQWIQYRNNKKKMWLKTYRNGDLHGLAEIYHDDESKMEQSMWKDDKMIWQKYWNKKGEPVDSYEEAEK
tara:strand:+ start:1317 stop:1913 length:597 start_codon:yes stop_codon:yes gene_type:complete